jgi:hypothetical protein
VFGKGEKETTHLQVIKSPVPVNDGCQLAQGMHLFAQQLLSTISSRPGCRVLVEPTQIVLRSYLAHCIEMEKEA